MIFQAIISGVC